MIKEKSIMRLLELRANKKSFHTVTFNWKGISIIRARQKSKNIRKTYNSVGKSLLIALIHFCLGSNKNKEFENKLPEWEFSLDFEIDGVTYTAVRNTSNQEIIQLDNKEYKPKEYNQYLGQKLFHNRDENIKYLSFRSLISRFIRPKRSSYVSYDTFIIEEQKVGGYPNLLNNSYLLGLDIEKVDKKYRLKDQFDDIKTKKSNIENDPIMKGFFKIDGDIKDIEIEIEFLEDRVRKLEKNISEFKVSEDYDQIRKEADEISSSLKAYKNKATALKNATRNIEKSLKIQPDISTRKITALYQEAEYGIRESIVKKLEEVENFNKKLLDNRKSRLIEEKKKIEAQLEDVDRIISRLGKQEDEKLYLLKATGSLEEYAKLNEELSNYKVKLGKIKEYKELLAEYENKIEEIKKEFIDENIETNKYLKDSEPVRKRNIQIFKSFAEQFYENKKAGIEIRNNTSENRLRYDIRASIDSDTGDGVGYVKLFCFDWTLLKAQHNHEVKFIFHDSRLLSEIDPRQVATLFQVAYKNAEENNFQYFISANQKDLDSIKDKISPGEYEKIIERNVILDLTDESDESKLLGIQVDLDYEKE
jgi:uncharacterized protein YydD (DUF2326 family)